MRICPSRECLVLCPSSRPTTTRRSSALMAPTRLYEEGVPGGVSDPGVVPSLSLERIERHFLLSNDSEGRPLNGAKALLQGFACFRAGASVGRASGNLRSLVVGTAPLSNDVVAKAAMQSSVSSGAGPEVYSVAVRFSSRVDAFGARVVNVVVDTVCKCKAGLGICKHIACVSMAYHSFSQAVAEVTSTGRTQKWHQPSSTHTPLTPAKIVVLARTESSLINPIRGRVMEHLNNPGKGPVNMKGVERTGKGRGVTPFTVGAKGSRSRHKKLKMKNKK